MRGYKSVWQSGWLPPHTHTHPHALVQARLPDWPKFCVFKKVFGQLFEDYLVFGKMLSLIWQCLCSLAIFHCNKHPNIDEIR